MGLLRLAHAFTTDCDHLLHSGADPKTRLRLLATLLRLYAKPFPAHGPGAVAEARVLGFRVAGFDARILRFLFREIFVHGDYGFDASTEDPLILDCGANVGMATLYFLWRYPRAEVHAFEPDAATFSLLQRNITVNGLNAARAHQAAVSDRDGQIAFYRDDSDPGHPMMSTMPGRMRGTDATVESVALSSFLERELPEREIDFLKLDIEGAEDAVLRDLAESGAIHRVRELVVEYHHHLGNAPSRLGAFLGRLEAAGFSYQLRAKAVPLAVRGRFQDVLVYGHREGQPQGAALA